MSKIDREKIEQYKREENNIKLILSNGFSYTGKIVWIDATTCKIHDYKKNLITILISEIVAIEEVEYGH